MGVQVTPAQLSGEVSARVAEGRPPAVDALLPGLVGDVEDLVRVQQQLAGQVVVEAAQHLRVVVGILGALRPAAQGCPLLGGAVRVSMCQKRSGSSPPMTMPWEAQLLMHRLDRLRREPEFV